MDIPESVDTQKKAQENHSKMAETPVPSLILSLSVSTIFTMLVATSYNIVDTYFVSDLGESSVAAVGIMFSVMALIQAVGYTWGMGAGSEIARLLGKQKKREAEQTLATALAGGILSGAVMAVIFAVPDEGPLTDYESWMPDFMGGLAKGIEKSRGMIQKAVSGVSSDMVINPKVSGVENMTGNPTAQQTESISGMLSAITSAIRDVKGDSGDIVIPVYLGGTMLDEVIVSAQQRANLRSGGR
jgi:hypothetical protein